MLCKGVRVSPIPDSFQNTAESLRGCHENTLSNGSQSRADNSLAGPPADLLPSPSPPSNGSYTDLSRETSHGIITSPYPAMSSSSSQEADTCGHWQGGRKTSFSSVDDLEVGVWEGGEHT